MMPAWRRDRLRRRRVQWTVRLVAIAVVGVLVYGLVVEPARLVERDYALSPPGWPARCDGLRLDVIADTHTGSPRNGIDNLDRVVARLLASNSDAVLMAGDYVILSVFMGKYVPIETIAEHLRPLTARKPVYAVLGNHDWWKNGPDVGARLAAAGVHMIDNQAVPVTLRGCRFWIAGLGDLLEGRPVVAGTFAAIDDDAPVIALTHEPDLFPRIPARAALTVTGHTHGGQINPFGLATPENFRLHSHGLRGLMTQRGRLLFVSPGIGTSIFPMRLGVPPEISHLTLHSARPPSRP